MRVDPNISKTKQMESIPFVEYKMYHGKKVTKFINAIFSTIDENQTRDIYKAHRSIISSGKVIGYTDGSGNLVRDAIFRKIGHVPNAIFINYFDFSVIYEIDTNSFFEYFDDIYYPVADDIDVFDQTLEWILHIDHDGYLVFCELHKSQ